MSSSEMSIGSQNMFGLQFDKGGSHEVGGIIGEDAARKLEQFVATGLGSRGGPNKVSNKYKRNPMSYLLRNAIALEDFIAVGLRSRRGPNKVTNKLKKGLSLFLYN